MKGSQETVEINSVNTALRELGPLVQEVQKAVEAASEAGRDGARESLADAASRLAGIRGTLDLLDVHGGAMLCREMGELAAALAEGTAGDLDAGLEPLLKGTLRLTDYLERIRAGQRDSAPVLLPLMNELRAARDAEALGEREVFFPDLSRAPARSGAVPGSGDDDGDAAETAARLRPRFQKALLGWYRAEDVENNLHELGSILQEFATLSRSPSGARLWGVCGALTEALADQGLEADDEVRRFMARVERLISHMARHGEQAVEQQIPVDLLRGLLYYVARSGSAGENVEAVRRAYDLTGVLGDDTSSSGFEGPDRGLLEIVAEGIREDIAAVKDSVEIYVHSEDRRPDVLQGVPEQLARIADTFSMVGLQDAHDTLQSEADVAARIEEFETAAALERLQALADVLLRVEGDLDRLLNGGGHADDAPAGDDAPLAGLQRLPASEYRALLGGVVAASLEDLAKVREAIAMYCSASDTGTDAVAEVPALLDEVHGALRMLPLARAEAVLRAFRQFIGKDIVEKGGQPDDDTQVLIADVVAGLEYYLEAVDHDRAGMVHLLQGAERAIEGLYGGGAPATHAGDESVVMESGGGDAEALLSPDAGQAGATAADDWLGDHAAADPWPSSTADADDASALAEGSAEISGDEDAPWADTGIELADSEPTGDDLDLWEGLDFGGTGEAGLSGIDASDETDGPAGNAEDDELAGYLDPDSAAGPVDMDEWSPGADAPEAETGFDAAELDAVGETQGPVGAADDDELADFLGLESAAGPAEVEASAPGTGMDEAGEMDSGGGTTDEPGELPAIEGEENGLTEDDELASYLELDSGGSSAEMDEGLPGVDAPETDTGFDATGETDGPAEFGDDDELADFLDLESGDGPAEVAAPAPGTGMHDAGEMDTGPGGIGELGELPAIEDEGDGPTDAPGPGSSDDPADWWDDPTDAAGIADDDAGGQNMPGTADDEPDRAAVETASDGLEPPADTSADGAAATGPGEDHGMSAAAGVDPAVSGSRLAILGDDVDEEIVEVYIEEALGELDRINEQLPLWRANPAEEEALITVRRAFHTLKGGGRLIGAELIGEFSWAMENMLNRVIDRSIDTTQAVFDTLDESTAALPQLIEQIQGNRSPIDGIDDLIERAHALSRGEPGPPSGGGSSGSGSSGPGSAGPSAPAGGDGHDEGAPRARDDDSADRNASDDTAESADPGSVTAVAPYAEIVDGEEISDGDIPDGDIPDGDIPDGDIPEWGFPEGDIPDAEIADGEIGPGATPAVDTGDEPAGEAPAADMEPDTAADEADETLLQIFAEEAVLHLAVIRERLPRESGGTPMPVDTDVLRALHTLHGSAQTADVESVVVLAGPMEQILKRHRDQASSLDGDEVGLFDEAVSVLETVVDHLPRLVDVPALAELQQRLEVTHRQLVEQQTSGGDSGENELLDIFIDEGDELVEACERAVQQWRDDPGAKDRVLADLQRNLHTLKGGARMANFPPIADLTHEIESLVDAISEGAVKADGAVFELMQEAVDALTVLLEQARGRQGVSQVDWLVDELRNHRLRQAPDHEGAAEAGAEPAGAPASDSPAAGDDTAAAEAGAGAAEPAQEGTKPRQEAGGGSEQIRVQADLLDNLVNFAGEVSIYHSRLNEHLGQYKFNLTEFEQTVSRLREQLRDMENETESQIIYRHQKDQEHGPVRDDFDPLEFDRYTRIQELSRSLAESVGDLDSIKDILDNLTRDAETLLLQQSRVSSDLQGGLMQTRMVRFDGLRARFARIVRQTAGTVGKQVDMSMSGGEIEVDRSIQERILAPLEHILRNAVSHGIEGAAARRGSGKPENGSLRIDLHRGGTDIIIEITDDGAGIDPEKVRRKAIDKGMIEADDPRDDHEIIRLILETGFSTADQVTQLSGRGVGMDVVDAEIRRLGGTLGIQTEKGVGTRFTVRLPVTLAINQAVLIEAGEETYAIPIASIEGVSQIRSDELRNHYVDRSTPVQYAGNEYELHHLGRLLGISEPHLEHAAVSYPVVMVRAGDERVALHVDQLVGRREVVVKPLGAPLNTLPGISGATIMADGTVVLILDVGGLVRTEVRAVEHGGLAEEIGPAPAAAEPAEAEAATDAGEESVAPTVLVVDDSITIRKVTHRVLARNGIDVATAKDGVDAVSWMGHSVPDLILLDIEMPRMDGYEVATYVRSEPRLAHVPIIMVTSRTGDKHRERAESIGVNQYLGKPYQETELMESIRELIHTPEAA